MVRSLITAALVAACAAHADGAEQHDGFGGVWLKSASAQVFVAIEPTFRILSFRKPGEPSLLADSKTNQQGLRLAFMEPEQIPTSFDPGNQPASLVEHAGRRIIVRLKEAAGLRYEVEATLAPDAPVLDLRYTLTNVGASERRVACWSLISYALDGTIVVPFGDNDRARRRLVLPWWTKWPQPGVSVARSALSADASTPVAGNACKIGLTSEPGWIAFTRDKHALISTVTFDSKATYPEGGANITLYLDANRCETEQVGPLTSLNPGASVTMHETLRLAAFAPTDHNPDTMAKALAVE